MHILYVHLMFWLNWSIVVAHAVPGNIAVVSFHFVSGTRGVCREKDELTIRTEKKLLRSLHKKIADLNLSFLFGTSSRTV